MQNIKRQNNTFKEIQRANKAKSQTKSKRTMKNTKKPKYFFGSKTSKAFKTKVKPKTNMSDAKHRKSKGKIFPGKKHKTKSKKKTSNANR